MSKLLRFTTTFLFFLLLTPMNSFATHLMGGEITWTCLSNGQYLFKFSVYRDCSGTALAPRGDLIIHNYPTAGQSRVIATAAEYNAARNNPIDRDISPDCKPGGVTFSCANGDGEAVFEYIRQADPQTLFGTPPAQGWIITWDDVARNPTDNLQGQPGMTLRAKIYPFSGSVADTCIDNSPEFREEATSLLCLGTSFTYNHNASDIELDSLVYDWARPLNAVGGGVYNEGTNPTFVAFQGGYGSGLPGQDSPFPDQGEDPRNTPATIDSRTGEIALTSFTSGKYVSVVQVSAYKCGELVAEIYRELQSNISAACALNQDPVVRPPFQDGNGNFTQYSDTVRAGALVTFNLQITDFPGPNNPNSDSVFVSATGFQWGANFTNANAGCANPPCATLSSPLPDSGLFAPPNKTFSWQTDCNHVAFSDGCVSLENTYNFVIRATDDACPIPGQTIATISITVLADSVILSPLINCVDVQTNGDVQLDWNTTPDPNNSFTAWMIYSATNINGPYTIVDSVKTYNQTTYTHLGAGADSQERFYYIRSRSGCKGIVQNVARDTVSTIFVQPQLDPTCVGITWNALSNPNPAGSAASYRIFKEYPIGSGMNFLQTSASTTFCDNFTACEDSVAYRIDLVNTVEGCTSSSNVIGFRFDRKPNTNFSVPSNTCSGPIAFTNLTTAIGGNLTYTWDFGDGSPTSSLTNPTHTFTGIGPFTVSLTASSGPGCDSTFSRVVTLGPDVDAGPDVAICPGGSVAIGGSPTTSVSNPTFQWSPSTGLSATNVANPNASPATTTTYTVTVTDANSCTNTDQLTVTVNTLPTADAGLNQTICEGTSITIGGSPTGPGGATYQWDNGGTLNDPSSANPIASPTITTTYTVTVSNGVNCTATDQVTITVDPQPTADAGADRSICPGGMTQLGGAPTSTTVGANFTWDNGASLNNAALANPMASPAVTTIYTVTVTHPNGCTNTDQVTVTVNTAPNADAGADRVICDGAGVTIGGSPTGPAGASFSWSPSTGLSSTSSGNPIANPTLTTTYTVTVTDGAGCTNTDQVLVTVNPLPNADAGPDQSVCPGNTVTLGGSAADPAGTTYIWSPTTGLSSATAKNPTLNVTSTQTYTVTVTSPSGCTATDNALITAFPSVIPDAGPDLSICVGGSTPIGGTASGGSTPYTFIWSPTASLSDPTLENPVANPTVTTLYSVTVTDANGCVGVDQMTVTVNINPTADAGADQSICDGTSVSLGGAPTGPLGASYAWDNATSLNDATLANPTANPTTTTTYTVTVTNGTNCTAVDQITITVDPLPTVDAGLDQTICNGGAVSIGGSPTSTTAGSTFSWSPATGLSDPTIANPSANPTTTTLYTVVVTHPNGCTASDQVNVIVNSLPIVDAGANVSICNGGSTIIGGSPTGPAGSSFVWDNGATLSNSTIGNPTASPTVTTTYTVTVTDANGCTDTDQVTVSVGSLPTADAGADQTICDGQTATLGGSPTGPASASFQWDNTASLNDPTIANPIANPNTTTTYTVTVTDGAGCSNTDQITITVNPTPTADAGPDQTICDGIGVQIGGSPTTTTASATFAWDNAASLSDPSIANPTASPTVTTIYTVTVTHPNGCTNTDQVTVNVNTNPTADAGIDVTICDGTSTLIGGSPTGPVGATFAWDNSASLNDASLANPTASPTVTTSYTVTVTDGNGCTDTDQMVVTVDPLPTVDAGADQTICDGGSVQIGGAPTSSTVGATFAWDNSTSLNDPSIANPTASPTITTTYTVTVTHPNGCTNTDQVLVTVNSLPTVDAGPDQFICNGGGVQIGGSPTGPAGSTYAWDNATTLNDATLANPTASPIVSTTYSVTVTDANGCTNVDQVLVTVGTLPTPDAGPDQTICEGNNATLGGSPTGPAGATYTWDNAATLNDASLSNPIANPLVTTIYTVTVTDGSGCSNTDQVIITVDPIPNVDAGPDLTICDGGSVQIGGSPTSSTTGAIYVWDNAGSLDDATIANPNANPIANTTYTVTVTHPNGCTSSDQMTVTVNSLPSIDAGADQTICAGTTATLGGAPTGPMGSIYNWDNAATLNDATISNPIANPLITTIYSVTVTDVNGCSDVDQVTITVNPFPNVDAGSNQTICEGQSITIGGSPTSSTPGALFSWDNTATLNDPSLANPTANPIVTTVYTVTVTDGNGCSITDQVTVIVNPAPVTDAGADQAICIGSTATLGGTPTGPAGSVFAWDNTATLNDATISNPIATPTITTTYTVTVTDLNGCTNTDQIVITVNPLPVVDAGANQTICAGTTASLGGAPTGPVGSTYSWDNSALLNDATLENPVATPITTTIFTVTVTDANGCINTDQVTITVDPIPDADAGADQVICDLQSVQIGGSPTSTIVGATFAWDNSASLDDPAIANPTANPSITTTYTVTVTHPNGCTNTDQVLVTVNPLPLADAGADQSICIGSSATIGSSPTGPSGSSFNWDNGATLNDATIANPIATPSITTTYTVTVTDVNGCTNTDQVVITVNPIPDADAGADQIICNLQSVQIGGTPTSTIAGATFAWDNAASLNDPTLANPTANPSTTTTYTVTVTHPNGCTNTDQMVVTVNPLPTADAGADQSLCIGGSIVIGGAPTGPAGASFTWDNSTSLSDPSIANPVATPIITTTYTVTVTDGNGCTNTDQVVITVNPLPAANAGLDQSTCSGTAITIGGAPTGPPGSTYSWDNGASLNDATAANPIANPTVTTTYTVTVTDINGCVNTDQVVVTVLPIPDAEAGPNQTICNFQAIPIGGAPTSLVAGATFAWDNGATLNNPALANPLASPNSTTTYTVTVTHPNGCTNTDQVTVVVNPLPAVDAGADQDICIGSSATLGGSPTGPIGATYSWDNSSTLNNAGIANPIASPTVTTTYTVTVTDLNGCVNTDQVVITVNPLPVADAGIDQTICDRDTINIGAPTNPLYTYAWDNSATLSSSTVSDPRAFPSVTTTYTVTVTETATSCTLTDQVVITVNPLPLANAGNDDTLCLGSSVTIGGSPTGPAGATYSWSNAAFLNDATAANPVASPTVTTTFTVTVTNPVTSCTSIDEVRIVVNPLPIADAGVDVTICQGDTIGIGGSPTGPVGATYIWSSLTSLVNPNSPNPRAFPNDTTTYTVVVTDTNGCVNTAQVTVNVTTSPNIDAGLDQTICRTDSVMIGGSPTGPAGATYVWTPSTGLSAANVANPMASPSDTTMYIVTVTDGIGCNAIDTVMVNVNPLAVPDFQVDQRCISDLAAFTDLSTISAGSIASWQWDFGDGGTSILQNPAYQYINFGVYDVKLIVTSSLGCIDSITKQVTIDSLPLADAGPDITICEEDTVTIGGAPTSNSAISYNWSPSFGLSDVSVPNPEAYPSITTRYSLIVTDDKGCVNFDTVEVRVNPKPIVSAGNDTVVCSYTPLQLNATGAAIYQWSPSTYLDDPFIQNPIATVQKSIDYVVEGIDVNGCRSTDTISVEVFNLDFIPADTAVCFGDSVQVEPQIEGDITGITYNWTPAIGLSNTQIMNPMASPPANQAYQLEIRNAAGCVDNDTIHVRVDETANVRFEYVASARCEGAVLEIENTSTNTDRYLWKVNGVSTSQEFNPTFTLNFDDTNTVSLLGWNRLCFDSTEVMVDPMSFDEIIQYKGTNVFTPNGDGINDIFDPGFQGEFIGCADFRIYDRWGEKVFDSNIGQYGWDGRTLRGVAAKDGIYYFVIIVAGKEVKGSVYLSR